MKSSELMTLAEIGFLEDGDKFIDQDGNIIIFSGKSFYSADKYRFWELIEEERVVSMCVDDKWVKFNV